MILINRNEVEPVAMDMVCRRGSGEAGEPYIAIDETDLKHASEGAEETIAIVHIADMPLEQIAESVCREIVYVMKKESDSVFDFVVSINCVSDVLISELCIVSDMLRNAVGDSKFQFGFRYVEQSAARSIRVLIFRKIKTSS